MDKHNKQMTGEESAGTVYGNISNASTNYGQTMFTASGGTGYAAERANHLYDKLTGHKVDFIGDVINEETGKRILNGADRVVDGIQIQTKYYKTGSDCISSCFKNQSYKYLNPDGSPMCIEVPKDESIYHSAVKAMEERIKRGEVPGVTDPAKAKEIVRRGHFTHAQTVNIAKAGTVESLLYDSANGAIVSTSAFGITTILTFATSMWNGDDVEIALKKATFSGLKVGGTTFVVAILSSQLSKAGLNSMLVSTTDKMVKLLGDKVTNLIANGLRKGTNIYGAAAMKNVSKLLRTNIITGTISIVVLSSSDVMNIFRGRISGGQLFKNVANTTASVAGGTAGFLGGAAAGAAIGSVIPGIGNAVGATVGAIAGSFLGGSTAGKLSDNVLSEFVENDADEMVRIIEIAFTKLASEYMLSKQEAEEIVDKLKDKITGKTLKEMYSSIDRMEYAKYFIRESIELYVQGRQKIFLPTDDLMFIAMKEVLEAIAIDEDNAEDAYSNIKLFECHSCGEPTDINKKYCTKCGVQLDVRMLSNKHCQTCNSPIQSNKKFCTKCGAEIK